ncbi:MAG: hypothetical protein ABW298_05825 [Candidatus Binatia bacterium]
MDEEYASYVLLNAAGQKLQDDSVLGAPRTTARWLPGETVKDRRVLTLAHDGSYEATIGVWAPRPGRHVGAGRWWRPRMLPFCPFVVVGDSVEVGSVH